VYRRGGRIPAFRLRRPREYGDACERQDDAELDAVIEETTVDCHAVLVGADSPLACASREPRRGRRPGLGRKQLECSLGCGGVPADGIQM
jgi:hypothetical protein